MREWQFYLAIILVFSLSLCFYAQKVPLAFSASDVVIAKSETPVYSVTFSPDAKYFATTWNKSVVLWNAMDNAILGVFADSDDIVTKLKFSGDSRRFLFVSDDNSVVVRTLSPDNLPEEMTATYRIRGTSPNSIPDADFFKNGYSMLIPLDGTNVTRCFRLAYTD